MMMNVFDLRQRGFTLLEALVALLVLSIGMLGVAAMQLKALQGAHAAYQRSIASLAAQDAQERLWAAVAAAPGLPPCPSSEVSSIETAWHAHWTDTGGGKKVILPGFTNSTIQHEGGCEFSITVNWDEERLEGGGGSFSYTVRLPETAP
ncbi:type IV pilus modification protein PilV [Halomonas mongoliensis]|uniref:Type IV pilus modification protein PilV n=1 Tax=Halomonas mongoliensis TaxID=321265 RepID=A0ABU1GL35_9GAMM|nr:type IV pilus modification protein PilV [Halomonas mongoliensis]MDR5892242.1 type IV pilus modification protein PilV [Halomonas mongoliensis]